MSTRNLLFIFPTRDAGCDDASFGDRSIDSDLATDPRRDHNRGLYGFYRDHRSANFSNRHFVAGQNAKDQRDSQVGCHWLRVTAINHGKH